MYLSFGFERERDLSEYDFDLFVEALFFEVFLESLSDSSQDFFDGSEYLDFFFLI